ncbi:MAG: hypothetical protein ACT4P5_15250, partial [Armatimonadota bacterium]
MSVGGLSSSFVGTAQTAPGWTTHRDPEGFSITYPAGWTRRPAYKSAGVEVAGPRGERAIILPVYVAAVLQTASGASVLGRLAEVLIPGMQWTRPVVVVQGVARMQGHGRDQVAVSLFAWVASRGGSAGYLYAVTAPEAGFRDAVGVLSTILQSYRAWGPAIGSQRYTTWREPNEGAFTLEVPEGWRVTGGITRPNPITTQEEVAAVSADGTILVYAGNVAPQFYEENDWIRYAGVRQGDTFNNSGILFTVWPYLPGERFIAQWMLPRRHRAYTVTGAQPLPQLAEPMNQFMRQLTPYVEYHAGQIQWRFAMQGRPYLGGALSITVVLIVGQSLMTPGQIYRTWGLAHLVAVEAPEDRYQTAIAVINHMVATYKPNEAWLRGQQELVRRQSQIIADMGRDISDTISRTYWTNQAIKDEISRRGANARLGLVDVTDPATGTQYKVSSGSNYYWMDQQGNVVGTNTHTRPDINFRELIVLP